MRRIRDKGGRKDERNTQNNRMGTVEEGESGGRERQKRIVKNAEREAWGVKLTKKSVY